MANAIIDRENRTITITKAFNDYARRVGALKEKDNNLSGEDFREGITAVITTMPANQT